MKKRGVCYAVFQVPVNSIHENGMSAHTLEKEAEWHLVTV